MPGGDAIEHSCPEPAPGGRAPEPSAPDNEPPLLDSGLRASAAGRGLRAPVEPLPAHHAPLPLPCRTTSARDDTFVLRQPIHGRATTSASPASRGLPGGCCRGRSATAP